MNKVLQPSPKPSNLGGALLAAIFNTDQGSQFTSPRFTGVLEGAGIRISMDGRGRWMDNVFIERLWRSLKYECIYLHAYETGSELRAGVTTWVGHYNTRRPHSALGGRTRDLGLLGTWSPARGYPRCVISASENRLISDRASTSLHPRERNPRWGGRDRRGEFPALP